MHRERQIPLKACRAGCGSYSRDYMAWYYASNNQQKGPVEQPELDTLVQQGAVTPATLVWQEGMANWQRYAEVMPAATVGSPGGGVAAPSAAPGYVACAECGRAFPPNEVIQLAGRNVCGGCKPIAVQKLQEGVATDSDAERIRKEHIKHEASVKSVGILYFLGGGLLLLIGLLNLTMGVASQERSVSLGIGVVFLALAGVQIWAGIGLRQLRPWARVVSGILSGIRLIVFPIGSDHQWLHPLPAFLTKRHDHFLGGLSRRCSFNRHRKIKYRTSVVVWVLLAVLFAFLFVALVAVYIGTTRHAH